jgi:hypothetical protein
LTIIQLLDLLKPVYLIQVHRFWESTKFSVNVSLTAPLTFISIIMVVWILVTRPKYALVPAIASVSLLFLNPMASIVLVSSLCIVTSICLSRRVTEYLLGLTGLLFILEAGALIQWIIFTPLGLANPLVGLADLESNMYYFVAQSSPLIMLTFSILGVMIPIRHFSRGAIGIEAQKSEAPTEKRNWAFFLGLIFVLSVAVAIYPYLPRVNPTGVNVGVDIPNYLLDLKQVEADPVKAFQISSGSRPLLYLLLFGFQKLTSLSTLDAIRWLPILLNPLLVLSTFFLASEMMGNFRAALYAGFFTTVGYTLSGGMYAYFLADMLMLSIILASMGFLLRSYRNGSRRDLAVASLLGGLFVFTHPWTLDQYVAPLAVTGVLVTYLYLKHRGDSLSPLGLILYCCVVASADVVKLLLLRGSIEGVSALATLTQGFTSIQMFWLDFVNSSRFYLGGFLTSLPLIGLAVIGIWKVERKKLPNTLILLFVAMTSAVYILGDVVVKSRLLYNVPIGILAAYGLIYLDDLIADHKVRLLITGTIVITLMTYLFRGLATIV